MSDMTREEAIEVIEQDIPCEHDKDLIEALDMAISALSESKAEWIPVSERLPKEGETVLVCYRTQGGIAQSVCEWFDMPNRGIVWSTLSERKPIAWQPLPEPYKGESEVAE